MSEPMMHTVAWATARGGARGEEDDDDQRTNLGVRECLRASHPEEVGQERRAFIREHTGDDLRTMIESGMANDVANRASHPRFVVPCAERQSSHAREHDGPGAHRARFQGRHERTVVEPPPAERSGSVPQRKQLGVRRRILVAHGPVAGARNNGAVANNDGANRHVAGRGCFCRGGERLAHPDLFRQAA